MNVYDFAMRMEEEHRAYYDRLALSAKTADMKTIFMLLADSEREHHEHLTLLKSGADPDTVDAVTLDRIKDRIHDLVADLNRTAVLAVEADGYRQALKQEETSIRLYEKLADQEPNPEAAEVLRSIASEERCHLEVVENIYEFIESPRTYLAWGEFSNLREY